jgi:hypothetical protein
VRVVSVKPWWAAAMASRRELVERVDLLAVADVEALVILVAQAGAWTEALALSPPPTPEQAEAAIQRRATGLADGRMHVARLRMSPEDATGQPVSWTAESVRSFAMP